jgi:hypothetical protein
MRPYSAITLSKKRATAAPKPLDSAFFFSPSGWWRSRRAHSMGVSVSETTAEIRIATVMVMANSWNRRPTTSP